MRKLCTILIALTLALLCVVLMPAEVQAAEVTASGTCGDNLTWTLDDAGTLTISGTGAMPNYLPGMYIPWMDYAEKITTIVLKDGVTTIGYGAFSGFSKLSSVAIPASVTGIGANAFANCSGLTQVFYCGTDEQWSAVSVGAGNTYLTEVQRTNHSWKDATLTAPKTCVFCGVTNGNPLRSGTCGYNLTWTLSDEGVLKICGTGVMTNYASNKPTPWDSYKFSIKQVVISNGVASIGAYAFYNCTGLKSVSIPNSVTSVGTSVFEKCGITNVTIPGSITELSDSMFAGCTSLTSVTIGEGVARIGECAFNNCTSLTELSIPDSIADLAYPEIWEWDVGYQYTVYHPFSGCINLTYNLYGNAKYLGNQNNPYLVLVEATEFDIVECTIHPNTKIILAEAFYFCTSLSKVYISDLTAWCNTGFPNPDIYYIDMTGVHRTEQYYCGNPLYYAQNLYINGKLTTDLVIPKGVTTISSYAFVGCDCISSVAIPFSVSQIGYKAFDNCINLENVYYDGCEEQWNKIAVGEGNRKLVSATKNKHMQTKVEYIEPSYTAMGTNTLACEYCGEKKTETIPAKFYGTSVNLGNTLDMYFGFYTGLVDEGGTVKFVREYADGTTETTTAPITSFKKNNSVYDITYTGLAAKEMCDTIHIYVYNGKGELVGEHADSIRSYILRQLREKDYGQEFRTLCVDLLNYGAAAQSTFGYNATDLANKDLTAEELAEGTQTVANYVDKQSIDGTAAAYYGTAYILETKISMNMAVRGSYFGDGCYALVSYTDHTGTEKKNIRLEGKKNNSVYEFTLDEIVVADGRCLLTIEFYKADGTKVVTVQDSMEGYTARNAQYYPLAEKMLAFSDSAYAYLH